MNGINQSFQLFKSTILARVAIGVLVLAGCLGCGQGANSIPGVSNFTVSVVSDQLYVSFVATELNWDLGVSSAVPGLKGSTVSISPDLQSSGTVFQFAIALSSLLGSSHGQGSLAVGAKTYKLKFGHRGGNQPVIDKGTGRVEISSHNHGYSVDGSNLPAGIEVTHLNLNDKTVEGLRVKGASAFSVQYHPEACPGPHDSMALFQRFISTLSSPLE